MKRSGKTRRKDCDEAEASKDRDEDSIVNERTQTKVCTAQRWPRERERRLLKASWMREKERERESENENERRRGSASE
jgi:hypothetical protein